MPHPGLKKITLYASLGFLVLFIFFAIKIYFTVLVPNTKFESAEAFVYIPTNANYSVVKENLEPLLDDWESFDAWAQQQNYSIKVKSGKFRIEKGMTNFQIYLAMRRSVPVKVTFNNIERLESFASRISKLIEADSTSIMQAFQDEKFLQEHQLSKEEAFTLLLPNTYEFYWDTPASKFREKMSKEYWKFWNGEREQQAKKIGLTPAQVTTLASIVHKESVKADERPRIAGVYLNRLQKGMPLQADPTVIFAYKLENQAFEEEIKRVTGKLLQTNSPYNTYRNSGLPPGPIFMPDVSAIHAVLNPEQHNYLYFCASTTRFGYHDFAVTYTEHHKNAAKYQAWLQTQGITK